MADVEALTGRPPNAQVGMGLDRERFIDLVVDAMRDERFLIVTPDDQEIEGKTDSRGRARVDGIFEEGSCRISFPDLYDEEWSRA